MKLCRYCRDEREIKRDEKNITACERRLWDWSGRYTRCTHLYKTLTGRENAQAEGQQDPAAEVAVTIAVVLKLLADLTVNLVSEQTTGKKSFLQKMKKDTEMWLIFKWSSCYLRSRLTMAYPTMMWSFSSDVSGRSSEGPSPFMLSSSSLTVCRVGGLATSVISSDCKTKTWNSNKYVTTENFTAPLSPNVSHTSPPPWWSRVSWSLKRILGLLEQ